MPIVRRNHGRGHTYVDADTGAKLPGVTSIVGKGIPKEALINWAVGATIDYAIDHWARLDALPISERMKELKGARWAEKDKATGRGTHVHRLAERLIAGERVKVPDEIAGHVEAYVRFLDEWRAEAVQVDVTPPGDADTLLDAPPVAHQLVERTVYSAEHRYCGTVDLIADLDDPDNPDGPQVRWLIDLLTSRSGVFGEKALQTIAYRWAGSWVDEWGGEHPIEELGIERIGVLWLRPTGYDLVPIEAIEDDHRTFLYTMEIARFVDEGRDLVGEPLAPPTTSTYRLVGVDEDATTTTADDETTADLGSAADTAGVV